MPTDAQRLIWLERMALAPGGILLHDGSESGRLGLGIRHGNLRRTLRQAIDDAMSPPTLKSKPKGRFTAEVKVEAAIRVLRGGKSSVVAKEYGVRPDTIVDWAHTHVATLDGYSFELHLEDLRKPAIGKLRAARREYIRLSDKPSGEPHAK